MKVKLRFVCIAIPLQLYNVSFILFFIILELRSGPKLKVPIILILNIIRTIFKHNSCESSDVRSKHMIYRVGHEVYGRI